MNISKIARDKGLKEETLRSRLRRGMSIEDAITKPVAVKHGMESTRVYGVWKSMIQRCRDVNCKAYKNYGGRGISVCDRWTNFSNFYDDIGDIPYGMTIDRKDNSGNYEPSNVRLTSRKQQNNNRRDNIIIDHAGAKMTLAEWSDSSGVPYKTLFYRVRIAGWDFSRAISEPVGTYHKRMNGHDID